MFTTPDGTALHPDWITRRFGHLVKDSGLPPVRLHDLRHGAATLAHAAGADLKTVQEQLGHTSIVLTADTYTSVLLDLHFKVAEATARLVLKAAACNPGRRYRSKIGPPKSAAPDQSTRPEPVRPKRSRKSAAASGWVEHWSRFAAPAREAVAQAAGIGSGTSVLDVGCGSGELCELAAGRGARVSGIDAASALIEPHRVE